MRNFPKLLAGAIGALGILAGIAIAQTIPRVTALTNNDLVQVIKAGAPQAGNVYASMLQLQGYLIGGNSQFAVTAPTLSSCGTSPSVVGNNIAGTVTLGTGTPTGCVVTFATAYSAAPSCAVVSQTAPATTTPAYSVSASAITIVQAAADSTKYDYICFARPAAS